MLRRREALYNRGPVWYSSIMQTTTTPTVAQHHDNDDGTVTVTYSGPGYVAQAITYESKRDASIESTLQLFPGTSRDWLERMHS